MVHDNKIVVSTILLMAFSTAYTIIENPFQVALAQTESSITTDRLDTTNQTKVPEGEQTINSQQQQQQTFRSTFDTFITSEPQAYGVYDKRESNTFSPGETILLYIEPAGFEYGTVTDDDNNTLYTIDFSAAFTISDTEGKIIGGQQPFPLDTFVSYNQNKEMLIPFSITQTTPLSPGNYIITYTIYDENSGKSFDIVKEVIISEEEEEGGGGEEGEEPSV